MRNEQDIRYHDFLCTNEHPNFHLPWECEIFPRDSSWLPGPPGQLSLSLDQCQSVSSDTEWRDNVWHWPGPDCQDGRDSPWSLGHAGTLPSHIITYLEACCFTLLCDRELRAGLTEWHRGAPGDRRPRPGVRSRVSRVCHNITHITMSQ